MVPKKTDSPKGWVGEIDNRSPFQSVRDAVNLFGVPALSDHKPTILTSKSHSPEGILARESMLHLAHTELNKLKDQIQNSNDAKAQARVELDKAKPAAQDLSLKLKSLTQSKEAVIQEIKVVKDKSKQLEKPNLGEFALANGFHTEELDIARKEYTSVVSEVNAAKKELATVRHDYEMSLDAKANALKLVEKSDLDMKANVETATQLSQEIYPLKQIIEQVTLISEQAQQEQVKIFAEKNKEKSSYKARLEESMNKLQMVKQEFDPETARNLEAQLAETLSEIETLRKEVENVKESDVKSLKVVTLELDESKQCLQKVLEEQNVLQTLVDYLKQELANLKKEHEEQSENEAETESMAGNLHMKLQKCKSELEVFLTEESKALEALEEMITSLNQLKTKVENAKVESEEMKMKAKELSKEAIAATVSLDETDQKLGTTLLEFQEAKSAEAQALDKIRELSQKIDAAHFSTSESGTHITIPRDRFESINRKAKECEKLGEMKVEAGKAQVEAVKASEYEKVKKLGAALKKIEYIKGVTDEALKKANMAEAAKKAVEGELQRWQAKEQKQVIPREAQVETYGSTQMESKYEAKSYKGSPERVDEGNKLDRQRSTSSKRPKKELLRSVSAMFQRKSSKKECGSPSYLRVRSEERR